jgi:hypothetical protein
MICGVKTRRTLISYCFACRPAKFLTLSGQVSMLGAACKRIRTNCDDGHKCGLLASAHHGRKSRVRQRLTKRI